MKKKELLKRIKELEARVEYLEQRSLYYYIYPDKGPILPSYITWTQIETSTAPEKFTVLNGKTTGG